MIPEHQPICGLRVTLIRLALVGGILFLATGSMQSLHAQSEDPTGNRWLLLCCGLPGDDEHREKMTAAVADVQAAAKTVFNVTVDRQMVLVADEKMQTDLADVASVQGICTRSSVEAHIGELASSLTEDDSLLTIFIGHSYLNGGNSQFNVQDLDFGQADFAKWTSGIKCREQIYVLTQPLSGFWIRPMKQSNRIFMTATEADLEFTGTEMPYAFADVLAGKAEHSEFTDIDQDGQLSLLDLYLATNIEIEGRFTAIERLQTEHGQLDDNGDGRGSEVQTPYLPVRTTEEEEEEEDQAEEDQAEEGQGDTEEDSPDSNNETATDASDSSAETPTEKAPGVVTAAVPPPINASNLDGYRSRFIILKPVP